MAKKAVISPTYLGNFGDSGVFRLDLASSGLPKIRSITIQDDNIISGGTGAASGFDLDALKIASIFTTSPFEAESVAGLDVFTFSNKKVKLSAGFLQPWEIGDNEDWNQDELFGVNGTNVDFAVATFNEIDALDLTGEGGSISIGEGGQITFTLNQALTTDGLYLYVADAGGGNDGFRVEVSTANKVEKPDGLELEGTADDDVINLTKGANKKLGKGDDLIAGQGGNDAIYSGKGNDKILGGEGDDLLDAGIGKDTASGGVGQDTFVIRGGKGQCKIKDFNASDDFIGLVQDLSFGGLDIDQKGKSVLLKDGKDLLAIILTEKVNQIDASVFVDV